MHPTDQAILRYHELLQTAPAAAIWSDLQEQMQARHLFFGARPVCSVLRPYFLHRRDYEHIAAATETLLAAIHRLYRAMRRGELDMSRLLALSAPETVLLKIEADVDPPDASARMDAFWHRGSVPGRGTLHFIEYNADSPGGLLFGDALSEIFLALEPTRRLAADMHLSTVPVRQRIHATLLAYYHRWCDQTGRPPADRPHIAIVDWRTVRTRGEFLLAQEAFQALGARVRICDPDELAIREGRLWVEPDFPVDIVYKRLVVNELIRALPDPGHLLRHPLVRAVSERLACVVNGLGVQALYNKALFALLSDEEMAHHFDRDQQTVIAQTVPWTRRMEERTTEYRGERVHLVEFVRTHRQRLVLKPVREYGGAGVILGWEVDDAAWAQAVERALREPSVVQERVPIPQEVFPVWRDDALHFEPRLVDVDPYVWEGRRVEHAGIRLSTSSILNVSAGGGSATPMFIIE